MWIEAIMNVGGSRTITYVKASEVVQFWFSSIEKVDDLEIEAINFKIRGSDTLFQLFYPNSPKVPMEIWVAENFKMIHYLDNHLPSNYVLNWDSLGYPYSELGAVALVQFFKNLSRKLDKPFEGVVHDYASNKTPIPLDELKESLPIPILELGETSLLYDSLRYGLISNGIERTPEREIIIKNPKVIMGFKEELDLAHEVLVKFGDIYHKKLMVKTGKWRNDVDLIRY